MRGDNPIRSQELTADGRLWIEHVWYTIQGEGPFAGLPAVFARTSGCWLKCYFCDTDFESFVQEYSPQQLAYQVSAVHPTASSSNVHLVVLTGGDPLRQNVVPFCKAAIDRGWHVQLETAGVKWVPGLEELVLPQEKALLRFPGVSIVCSPKTGKVCDEMELALGWKYIIESNRPLGVDGLPMYSTQTQGLPCKIARPFDGAEVYIQPCDTGEPESTKENHALAARIAMTHGYRMSLQQHKILGLE